MKLKCEKNCSDALDITHSLEMYCIVSAKIFREFIEALDLFVGRYLVIIAAGYIMLKFVHFKVFPDFP